MLTTGIIWSFLADPAPLAVLGAALVLAWPLGRRGGLLGVLFVVALGGVLTATATSPLFHLNTFGIRPYLSGFLDPGYLVRGFAGTTEKLANIALFVPPGLLGMLLWRRPAAVFAGCVALTFAVESWQSINGRGGDAVDVVHNAFGALLGILLPRVWIAVRIPPP